MIGRHHDRVDTKENPGKYGQLWIQAFSDRYTTAKAIKPASSNDVTGGRTPQIFLIGFWREDDRSTGRELNGGCAEVMALSLIEDIKRSSADRLSESVIHFMNSVVKSA
jgi:hypothetical protein